MLPRPAVPAAASPRAPVASNPRRGLAPPHVSPAARLGSGSYLRVHRRPLDSAPLPCVPPAGRLLAASACPSSARLRARCRLPPHAPRAPGRGQDRYSARGVAWSHIFVDPPPLWKLTRASCVAPRMELLHLHPFGGAPGGAGFGAAPGALPNRAKITFVGPAHPLRVLLT
ncbi:hypothetical protein PVAP13_2NG494103 [Panicum virgatum]|uniref:Uncharacterized protein n=1 Tax=Panicum virgatum TaxID=38727 RepID=A0A8T0VPU7_PANVG|nr:hypothetical protein PVAP13_2NG494103 [Panicum virgatum]